MKTFDSEIRTRKENAHGQVYRLGRARVQLHLGRGRTERQTSPDASSGDECPSLGRLHHYDPSASPLVLGGGDASELALRSATWVRSSGRTPTSRDSISRRECWLARGQRIPGSTSFVQSWQGRCHTGALSSATCSVRRRSSTCRVSAHSQNLLAFFNQVDESCFR